MAEQHVSGAVHVEKRGVVVSPALWVMPFKKTIKIIPPPVASARPSAKYIWIYSKKITLGTLRAGFCYGMMQYNVSYFFSL